jgi:hypothetical protein
MAISPYILVSYIFINSPKNLGTTFLLRTKKAGCEARRSQDKKASFFILQVSRVVQGGSNLVGLGIKQSDIF